MSSSCCSNKPEPQPELTAAGCCGTPAQTDEHHCHDEAKTDWLFWSAAIFLGAALVLALMPSAWLQTIPYLDAFVTAQVGLIGEMWIGMLIGVISVGLMNLLPKNTILSAIGQNRGVGSILRAAAAGIVLDLCNHGLLLIAGKLYKSGVRYSQVLAFLIASPWNSLSLTIVMFALLGWQWTLAFIVLSFLVAVITGLVVDQLESAGKIMANPNTEQVNNGPKVTIKQHLAELKTQTSLWKVVFIDSFAESKMIMRWLLFGMVLAALIKTFVSQDVMQTWFGATLVGLGLTLVAATVIEVCSEGLLPVAADLLTRANAPGNAFTFMMAGVSTDYTEIMVLKETTGRWKMAFLLPIITLPQILILGIVLNQF